MPGQPSFWQSRDRLPAPGVAASADDYLTLFSANPVPALLVDAGELRVRAVNDAARRHFGYAENELQGLPFYDLLDDEDHRTASQHPPGWIATRSQWRIRHRNGETSVAHLGPVLQFAGRPTYYLWSAPVLPEKPASDRPGGEMVAFAFAAFHDLKEPLHLVRGYLELLRPRVGDDAESLDFLETALTSTERMQAIVLNLLEYFRLQTNATRPEPVDMAQALGEAILTLRPALEAAAAQVRHGPLPTVMADRLQVRRLLQNLVSNAVKFTGKAPPRVGVSAEERPGEWLFRVDDNGIGIPADARETVFEPFHRLHSVDAYAGTGLGLSTCRLIVTAHGGRIWAEEAPGGGTRIAFTLPKGGA